AGRERIGDHRHEAIQIDAGVEARGDAEAEELGGQSDEKRGGPRSVPRLDRLDGRRVPGPDLLPIPKLRKLAHEKLTSALPDVRPCLNRGGYRPMPVSHAVSGDRL